MEIISYDIKHSLDIKKYFENDKLIFLDIETTGLSREYNEIYLIGILYYSRKNNTWVLNQYFSTNEEDLLKLFIENLPSYKTIVNYNGDSFDIPFLNSKFKKYNLNYHIDKDESFDLYRYIKKHKGFLALPNLKLKSIEEYLGVFREDKFSGYECIELFKTYKKTGNTQLKKHILRHNYDDLVNFLDIIIILDIIRDKRSIISKVYNNKTRFLLDNPKIEKDFLIIKGTIDPALNTNIVSFDKNIEFITKTNNFICKIELKKAALTEDINCYYILNIYNIIDNSPYNMPKEIVTISIGKELQYENIKSIISSILNNYI